MIPVASRETVVAGSMFLAVVAAKRMRGIGNGPRKKHHVVSELIMWLSQDELLGRATEVHRTWAGWSRCPSIPRSGRTSR